MTDDTTRFPPWMCSSCGYVMDAASRTRTGPASRPPAPGDLSICLNCGAPYELDAKRVWRPATPAMQARWPAEARRAVAKAQAMCRLMPKPDLAKRGGRA